MYRALCSQLLSATLCLVGLACTSPDKVTIGSGVLQGSDHDGVLSFKGVPYAAPPVGNLRWQPPQPAPAWSGVRSATTFGHDCMQLPSPSEAAPAGTTTPSEDCLFLNIWTPANRPAQKLPVIVWIHGGGFLNGGSSVPVYDGSAFAGNGVVLLTFNYRLGRFGFFAHPALTNENPSGLLGNYTYMDMIALLQWVQRNIAAFGGDAANVTVMGESAGGGAVHFLLTSPASRGLFSKGIIQSGGGRAGGSPRLLHSDSTNPGAPPSGETLGLDFASSQGITGEDSAALAALRKLPPEAIVNGLNIATRRKDPVLAATSPAPMVDGKLIVAPPQSSYLAGTGMKVPLIIGANDSDLAYPQGTTIADFLKPFGSNSEKARAVYDPDHAVDVQAVGDRIARDRGQLEPARFVASLLSAQGQPVWEYRFSYVAESMRTQWNGAPHASDVPFVFDTVAVRYGKNLAPADAVMARSINAYIVAFARTGNPNGAGRPEWPAYSARQDVLANFTAQGVLIQPDPFKVRLDLTEQTYRTP